MSISSVKTGEVGTSLLAGNPADVSDFESIATTTVGSGGVTDVTFSSIPSTYTHLQIRGLFLSSSTGANLTAQYNGDSTSSNYKGHYLYGSGSAASAGVTSYAYGVSVAYIATGSSTNGCAFVYDILDYSNTNKYKTFRDLDGQDSNGSGAIELVSGLWMSTSAITSIKLTGIGGTIAQYSHFALYGIRTA